MSNDCLLLRKEVHSLGNRLAKEPNNNALQLTFCNCRRELKKGFFESLIQQIKDFWNNINKYKRKTILVTLVSHQNNYKITIKNY
jgi:hypothetical protein